MTFRHAIHTESAFDTVSSRFLVCSNLALDYYHGMTDEERQEMRTHGLGPSMPWINAAGQIDQICAVMSLQGDVVFSFGEQVPPNKLLSPFGVTPDERRAAVI